MSSDAAVTPPGADPRADVQRREILEEPGASRANAGAPEDDRQAAFVTCAASMARIKALIHSIADTDLPVLLLGESGVGKEVVAREIHRRSHRCQRPFIKLNCAALPAELLESELFGHERGAFTGATADKPGKFELAHRGTIFLDEIGEMELRLQAKLLQVLQDEEFFRVGGKKSLRVDARVVCATNRDLEADIRSGRFRGDLFYRLNVVAIRIPPLRERREEIPVILEHFLDKYRRKYGRPAEPLPGALLQQICAHDFPGNVRELENLVRRLVVLRDPEGLSQELAESAGRDTTGEAAASPTRQNGTPTGAPPPEGDALAAFTDSALDALRISPPDDLEVGDFERLPLKELSRRAALLAEREAILAALSKTAWNKRKAADRLRISYKALLYKIKECGIVDPRQLMSQP